MTVTTLMVVDYGRSRFCRTPQNFSYVIEVRETPG
jgi:hypothetical protein